MFEVNSQRNVLTIATGKAFYLKLAVNLARSFYYWNEKEGINFYLATDSGEQLPADLQAFVQVIKLNPGEIGESFSTKLHLDKLAPPGRTLFIDSDCLIYGRLSDVFEKFKGNCVSVIGNYISSGEWFGKVSSVLERFALTAMPKFNGGIYYIENGEKAKEVYEKARELEQQYDKIGFVRLRGRPNDEVLMSIALQLCRQSIIEEDGTIMSDPQACPGRYEINVLSGKTLLRNPPYPHPLHRDWYPFTSVSPVIVHFLGYYTQHYPYKMEESRLKLISHQASYFTANALSYITIGFTGHLKQSLKNFLRPVVHKLYGPRKLKLSQR